MERRPLVDLRSVLLRNCGAKFDHRQKSQRFFREALVPRVLLVRPTVFLRMVNQTSKSTLSNIEQQNRKCFHHTKTQAKAAVVSCYHHLSRG